MQERFEGFTLLISSISKQINKIKTKEVEEYKLKGSHVLVTCMLNKYGALTLKQICEHCTEDKASVSRSVELLKNRGLVSVKGERSYKNAIELTEEGKRVASEISKKIDGFVEKASGNIPEDKRQIMYECLYEIRTNLQKITKDYED